MIYKIFPSWVGHKTQIPKREREKALNRIRRLATVGQDIGYKIQKETVIVTTATISGVPSIVAETSALRMRYYYSHLINEEIET